MNNMSLWLCIAASLAACGDDGGDVVGNEAEVITTVVLRFSPEGGGVASTFTFDDPDGDGGDAPVVDDIVLGEGSYDLAIDFENRLEDPPEDIGAEVRDEGDSHQIFFTGDAPVDIAYADSDSGGLPIGLDTGVVASAGVGRLTVTLRHLPPLGGAAVKVAGLADEVEAGGFAAIGGTTDAQVTFDVTIQ